MITNAADATHQSYMNQLLAEICDDTAISKFVVFKGGTCATMLGFLDRFSVDLDFDCFFPDEIDTVKSHLKAIFVESNFKIKKEFDQATMYELGYKNPHRGRSTLKISLNTIASPEDIVKVQFLPDINRYLTCQTVETMFANKLGAIMGRYDTHKAVAGRDLYDIHHFFMSAYTYHIPIIFQRTGMDIKQFLTSLIAFIPKHFNQDLINQDLNTLLSPNQFHSVRKVLIPETVALLKNELAKLT